MIKSLKGKKIAILSADGFEKAELVIPMKTLKALGAVVEIVSLHHGKIRGMNLHKPATTVKVDKVLSEVFPTDYDCLFIPGGFINPDLLRQSQEAREFVRTFEKTGRPIASLCHGPWVLASAGILKNRSLTSWPGIRDDLVNAGATWMNRKVVSDRNLVTSRGPQDLLMFIPAMVELFSKGAKAATENRSSISDPQVNEAPILVQQTVSKVSNFPYKWASVALIFGLGTYRAITKGVSVPHFAR